MYIYQGLRRSIKFRLRKNKNAATKSRNQKRGRKEKGEITKESKSVVHIPQDIIENILVRLPLKSLARFKTVCQAWCSSILDLVFRNQSVLSLFESSEGQFFHTITDEGTSTEKFPVPWGNLDSYSASGSKVYVSNSCNGMVLICVGIYLYLFNPSTRYFVKVMTLNYKFDSDDHSYNMLIGLYYDDMISDYKAVVLIYHRPASLTTRVLLVETSLKGKRWNNLNHTFKAYDVIVAGPVVNGRLHWLKDEEIILFNPVLKVFEELPSFQPPQNHRDDCEIVGIGIIEGCLCVSRIFDKDNFEIIAMKEYGVPESWTRIYSFSESTELYRIYHCNPLLLRRADELIVSLNHEIWVHDLGKNSFKEYSPSLNDKLSTCSVSFFQTTSFVQNMNTPTGYYWNQTEHEKFGNTEDFVRINHFWRRVD